MENAYDVLKKPFHKLYMKEIHIISMSNLSTTCYIEYYKIH